MLERYVWLFVCWLRLAVIIVTIKIQNSFNIENILFMGKWIEVTLEASLKYAINGQPQCKGQLILFA